MNVLQVLGITNQDPQTLRYYVDDTTGTYVIAAKGVPNGGQGTPVCTVLTFGNSFAGWNVTDHSELNAEDVTVLNGNLTGTSLFTRKYPRATYTQHVKFVALGTISGQETIVKAAIIHVYTN